MTRDEALKAVAIGSSCVVWSLPNERPEETQARMIEEHKQFVRRLEMLGLLKLEKRKTATERATDVFKGYMSADGALNIVSLLEDAGLKIVEV
ncbi:hypothetical protein [Tardiphaga sp. 709]|uniref:hypothetical protein n=1 Tax=Tardiphaga sp. 709 TaxID=3076039 RepID=UPI0028E1963B|nr:hypothetical protein [Tardiphaga sp. 709]WNV09971.1 hypothetical protein RSO67_01880 [Tardiphaga sp. 709]